MMKKIRTTRMPRNKSLRQFIKFALIGVLNTIVGYGIYYALLFAGIHYIIALLLSFVAGAYLGFILNKTWVFCSTKSSRKELPRYLIVYISSLLINLILLPIFVEIFHFDPKLAQLFFLLILSVYSFIGLKYWSFS